MKLADQPLPKWPQMLTTGKSVSTSQAKEIIFRTDSFLTDPCEYSGGNNKSFNDKYRTKAGLKEFEKRYKNDGLTYFKKINTIREKLGIISTSYVSNNWASCAFIFGPHGWCHPNGTIMFTDNVGKWPSIESVVNDWKLLAQAFPELDLTATLMNGEESEENIAPVVNIRVKNQKVSVKKPDLSVHDGLYTKRDFDDPSFFSLGDSRRELGLPNSWYDEFAERVKKALIKLKYID